jgi:hypothetical protein
MFFLGLVCVYFGLKSMKINAKSQDFDDFSSGVF